MTEEEISCPSCGSNMAVTPVVEARHYHKRGEELARVTAERDELKQMLAAREQQFVAADLKAAHFENLYRPAEAERDALQAKVREFGAELRYIHKAYANAGGAQFSDMQRGADAAVERCQIEFRSLFGLEVSGE